MPDNYFNVEEYERLSEEQDRLDQESRANDEREKAEAAAERLGLPVGRPSQLQHLLMDLSDLESVRTSVDTLLDSLEQPLDALVCNAAVYLPRLKKPQRSAQGYEVSMATNHFGHFLLIQLLLDNLYLHLFYTFLQLHQNL